MMADNTTRMTLTAKEAANALGVSLPVLYELTHQQDFPAIRVGRKVLVPTDKLRAWLDGQHGQVLG